MRHKIYFLFRYQLVHVPILLPTITFLTLSDPKYFTPYSKNNLTRFLITSLEKSLNFRYLALAQLKLE